MKLRNFGQIRSAAALIGAAALISMALGACTKTEKPAASNDNSTAQQAAQANSQALTAQATAKTATEAKAQTAAKTSGEAQAPATQLKIEDIKVGSGAEAKAGAIVTVNYTGTLLDGTKFDSSLNPGRSPFKFHLGAGEVIQGWDKGVAGMRVGGERKLVIPPQLAYGERGAGGVIPPNATLVFDVQLLAVN